MLNEKSNQGTVEELEKKIASYEHFAGKLIEWRHCMSYNDSYFGEPAGLLKGVVAELENLSNKRYNVLAASA